MHVHESGHSTNPEEKNESRCRTTSHQRGTSPSRRDTLRDAPRVSFIWQRHRPEKGIALASLDDLRRRWRLRFELLHEISDSVHGYSFAPTCQSYESPIAVSRRSRSRLSRERTVPTG